MKFCPTCREIYDAAQRFCESDGTSLRPIAAAGARTHAPPMRPGAAGRSYTSTHLIAVGSLGLIAGIVVVMTAMMGAFSLTRNDAYENEDTGAQDSPPVILRESRSAQPLPSAATSAIPLYEEVAPTPSPAASPGSEEEGSAFVPTTTPSVEARTESLEAQGPYEAGGEGALIRLKDGATIVADDVWVDRYGFWYRRGGLVARVERGRIASVTRREETRVETSARPVEETEAAKTRTPALQVVEP